MRAVLLVILALWLAGCASSQPPWPTEADAVLPALEARLLNAPTLRVDHTVASVGAFPSTLVGTFSLGVQDRVILIANGSFGPAPQRLVLANDEEGLRGMHADSVVFQAETPPALRAALVVGMTRMGLLHNLARLTSATPPDHAEGGVAEWVTTHDAAWGARRTIDGRVTQALHFAIRVSGTEAGNATLWLDTKTGLPVRREQVVHFPSGTMTVTENYRQWSLDVAG